MLMIRLSRVGRKNDPSFRIVVTDSKNAAKSGKFLEVVGSYNARVGKAEIKESRVSYWLGQGVQMSGTVQNLFVSHKLIDAEKSSQVKTGGKRAKKRAEVKAVAASESAMPTATEQVPAVSAEPSSA